MICPRAATRSLLISKALKVRSICCWRWRARRKSISPRFRFCRWLSNISGFISEAQKVRLELAADYLVMAAWLAYLKSRLLLPRDKEDPDTTSAEDLALRLQFRLMRLDAMRNAAAQLMTRSRLGRDVFERGMPETVKTTNDMTYTAVIYDLLKAYADQRRRTIRVVHVVKARRVWSIKDARVRLEKLDRRVGRRLDAARYVHGAVFTKGRRRAHRACQFLWRDAGNGARGPA